MKIQDIGTQSAVDAKKAQIEQSYKYRDLTDGQVLTGDVIQREARKLAMLIVGHTPASREQSIALTELETAVLWANAAIARHGE